MAKRIKTRTDGITTTEGVTYVFPVSRAEFAELRSALELAQRNASFEAKIREREPDLRALVAAEAGYGSPGYYVRHTVSDDVRDLLWSLSDGVASRPALVLGASAARVLVFSGDPIFRDVALIGAGTLGNVPTFTSLSPSLKNYVVAVDADGILTFDGSLVLDRSLSATIELDDAPSGGTLTSLFQKNLVGIRSIRYLAWAKRADAVAYLDLTAAGSPS